MKLLPFNLERALAGDKVATRDERDVAKVVYFPESTSAYKVFYFKSLPLPLLGGNTIIDGDWVTECGDACIDCQTQEDLFMVATEPVKKTYWVNVYGGSLEQFDECGFLSKQIFDNESHALHNKNLYPGYIKTISFEIEG